MKNTHIPNLLQEVPKDIRLEVYKEALELITTHTYPKSDSGYALCLLLPSLLWDLEYFCDNSPDDSNWVCNETLIAFPELTQDFINNLSLNRGKIIKNTMRIKFLQDSIKLLS